MNIRTSLQRKMILYLIPAVFVVFGASMGFVILKSQGRIVQDAQELADKTGESYAEVVKHTIDSEFDVARGITYAFDAIFSQPDSLKPLFFDEFLKKVITDNPQYISFWLNAELAFINKNYEGKSGRARFTYYRDQFANVKYKRDTLDLDASKINQSSEYQKMKRSKLESIMEPYFFSYTENENDQILETSVCIPIIKGGEFAGLIGSDIELSYFQQLIQEIKLYGDGYAYILSNQGNIIAFPDDTKVGKIFSEVFPEEDKLHTISQNIAVGNTFSYKGNSVFDGQLSYNTFVPIDLGETNTPWTFVISIPYKSVIAQAGKMMWMSFIIVFIGFAFLVILIVFIAKNITNPIKYTTRVLKKMAKGEVDKNDKMTINTGDEIEEMANSVNQLIEGLNRTAEFARTIGAGNLNAEYEKSGENDMLGNSLLEMRQSLILAEEEEKKRKIEDEKQNWATQGLAKFGDILRQDNQDIEQLSFNIMRNLVDYVDAIQGGLFIKNDDNQDEVFFELAGAIAYSRQKVMESRFGLGESLVGRCAFEKLTIYMEEVPDTYVHVTSGLGESNPRSILLVPALLNDEVYAIIELVSFNKFEKYQIEFVEKIGESIASTISNARISDRTNKLLEQSKQQSEELAAQEEEMRQNLEELQATQEEVGRLREEEKVKNEKLIAEVENNRKALLKILDYLPDKIYLKDSKGKMLVVNKTVLKAHGLELEDMVGKTDFDFIPDKALAKKLFEQEQEVIRTGIPFKDTYTETLNNTGVIYDSIKFPFFIDYLNETGVLSVHTNITDRKDKEERIKELINELEKLEGKK